MKSHFVTFLMMALIPTFTYSMGGDKLGPNGGYITMPSTYHLELVEKKGVVRIYLLDIAMKNPIVENSSVILHFMNQETKTVQCAPTKNYFSCEIPNKNLKNYKKLEVESTRKKVVGDKAIYELPLRLK